MRTRRTFDWFLFLPMMALVAIGTVAIWSAGNARAEAVFHGMWLSNLTTAVVGLLLYFILSAVDYRKTIAFLSVPAFVLALLFLIAVLFSARSSSAAGDGCGSSSRARFPSCA